MKPCILQDSSFLIATLNDEDFFHKDAISITKQLSGHEKDIKFVLPSVVFFEVFATLIKKGIPKETVEQSLWRFLIQNNILTVSLLATMAFKLGNRLANKQLSGLKTSDFIIANIGLDYDAQILTFDKKMRERVGKNYPNIYYCSKRSNMKDETERFLNDLQQAVN